MFAPISQPDGNHVTFTTINWKANAARAVTAPLDPDTAHFVAADADRVVAGDAHTVRLFDRASGGQLHQWPAEAANKTISATINGNVLLRIQGGSRPHVTAIWLAVVSPSRKQSLGD